MQKVLLNPDNLENWCNERPILSSQTQCLLALLLTYEFWGAQAPYASHLCIIRGRTLPDFWSLLKFA